MVEATNCSDANNDTQRDECISNIVSLHLSVYLSFCLSGFLLVFVCSVYALLRYYRPPMNLREDNVFSHVCQSVQDDPL